MSPKKTSEGHVYEAGHDTSNGLPCDGVVTPTSNMAQVASKTFDAVIIGAGFTGLTAARDLTLAGWQVLVLEGRDRIGGRTWTSNEQGHLYEMGGTWIHWEQPHVYREMARYNLHRDFVVTSDTPSQPRSVSVDDNGELHQLTLETFDHLADEAFKIYKQEPVNGGEVGPESENAKAVVKSIAMVVKRARGTVFAVSVTSSAR